MSEACSMHWTNGECVQHVVMKMKGKSHFEGIGVDGRIILKCISKTEVLNVWTGFT
jgi:hypothetical protein